MGLTARQLRALFLCFAVSGACSLVDEVVWLRLAMAAFGVTTPMVSVVLSVFMAGLALGSWLGGSLSRRLGGSRDVLRAYGWIELAIGVSAVAVPWGLRAGHALVVASAAGFSSTAHYLAAGAILVALLLPFCTAMGATLPLGVAVIGRAQRADAGRGFSFLYLANVIGATCGTLASALVLIELMGFARTLLIAAAGNGLIALIAWRLAAMASPTQAALPSAAAPAAPVAGGPTWLLFATGFASMGMEVVWTRLYTPFLGTFVYAFAKMLACYLLATFLGTLTYRRRAREQPGAGARWGGLWLGSAICGLLPLATADPRLLPRLPFEAQDLRLIVGIAPLCALLGFVTPMLVDRFSQGDARRAGRAYSVNVVGCIVGPLAAGFVLLPALGERGSLAVLAAPLLAAAVVGPRRRAARDGIAQRRVPALALAGALAVGATLVLVTRDYGTQFSPRVERRDSTATVVATGTGLDKRLLVNGYGMTTLTPITKIMAHLPLALLPHPPQRVATLCFGIGTTFRSALSWGVPTVGVELTPSVPGLFGYFHADAERVLRQPGARIVVDDARRYLERSRERYDLIAVDPPPPVSAAGSSLLYSREFASLALRRLADGGVLEEWLPGGDETVVAGVLRALESSFPNVRVFRSYEGWGYHFLASEPALPRLSGAAAAERLPDLARRDLVEWGPFGDPAAFLDAVLSREIDPAALRRGTDRSVVLTDDRPLNEYFLLRDWLGGGDRQNWRPQRRPA